MKVKLKYALTFPRMRSMQVEAHTLPDYDP